MIYLYFVAIFENSVFQFENRHFVHSDVALGQENGWCSNVSSSRLSSSLAETTLPWIILAKPDSRTKLLIGFQLLGLSFTFGLNLYYDQFCILLYQLSLTFSIWSDLLFSITTDVAVEINMSLFSVKSFQTSSRLFEAYLVIHYS